MSTKLKYGKPTHQVIANLIENLREALQNEYGSDYSFVVLGEGKVIAASNNSDGKVIATF